MRQRKKERIKGSLYNCNLRSIGKDVHSLRNSTERKLNTWGNLPLKCFFLRLSLSSVDQRCCGRGETCQALPISRNHRAQVRKFPKRKQVWSTNRSVLSYFVNLVYITDGRTDRWTSFSDSTFDVPCPTRETTGLTVLR